MTDRELARRLVIEKAVIDTLTEWNDRARDVARQLFGSGDAVTVYDGDVELGRVARERVRVTVRVQRGSGLLAWLDVNAPNQITREEVVTVTDEGLLWIKENHPEWLRVEEVSATVSDAWVRNVEGKVKTAGGRWPFGTWTDPDTGEDRDGLPPFVQVDRKPGNLTVNPTDAVDSVVAELLAARLPELPAIEAKADDQ